jgi:hypothetical protein
MSSEIKVDLVRRPQADTLADQCGARTLSLERQSLLVVEEQRDADQCGTVERCADSDAEPASLYVADRPLRHADALGELLRCPPAFGSPCSDLGTKEQGGMAGNARRNP